jgi:hypothetical protein
MAVFEMNPSPTQHEFIMSEAFENCIVGPRGEGKTDAGQMAIHVHASRQDRVYRPLQWAIVRDTWKNLERTTLQSYLNPSFGSFAASIRSRIRSHDGGKILELPGWWKIYLFGVDTTSDLNAVLSLQLAGAWVEEAAPAAEMKETEMIGGGLAETTYQLLSTSLRQPVSTNRRMQVTMNYPDEEHWSWKLFWDRGNDERRLFRIPRGENKHVDDQYRKNMERALAGRPDLLARLVIGRPARVQVGEAVTPEYDEDVHRSRVDLDPVPSLVGFRFWDGGRNPTCLIHQITPIGQLICIDSLRGENTGIQLFIREQVKPLLARRYPWEIVPQWRDLGDPAMMNPGEQTELTAAKIISEELLSTPNDPAFFEGGVSDPFARRESLRQLLMNRITDHLPAYLLSKHEGIVHRALAGGWHYHKDQAGRVLRDSPVKDIHSHPGDALGHSIAKLFPIYQDTGVYPGKYGTEYNMFA